MTTETEVKKTNWVVDKTVNAVPKTQGEKVDEDVKENWMIAFGEIAEVQWRYQDHGFIMPGKKDALRTVVKNGKKTTERYDVFKPKYVPCPATILRDKKLPEGKRYKDDNLTRCCAEVPEGLAGKNLMRWCIIHMEKEHADLYYEMHKGSINPTCDTQYKIPENDGRLEAPPQHFVVEFVEWKADDAPSRAHMTPDDALVDEMREQYDELTNEKNVKQEQKKLKEVGAIINKEGK